MPRTLLPILALGAVACRQGVATNSAPGTSPQGFRAIAPDEAIRFTGTEPFWGGSIEGNTLVYSTPENIDGTVIAVERFTGQGGLGFSGKLDAENFDLLITAGQCSDGMSDRTYPYTATLKIGNEQREGCAYTDRQPFSGTVRP